MGDLTSVSGADVSLGLIFAETWTGCLRGLCLSFGSSGAAIDGDFGDGAGARKGLSLMYPSSI